MKNFIKMACVLLMFSLCCVTVSATSTKPINQNNNLCMKNNYPIVDATNMKISIAKNGITNNVFKISDGSNTYYFKTKKELTTDKKIIEDILLYYLPKSSPLFIKITGIFHENLLAKKKIDNKVLEDKIFKTLKLKIGKENFNQLIEEINKHIYTIRNAKNWGLEVNSNQDFSTRNVVATKMAELFLIPDLIVKSEMVILRCQNRPDKYGHIMNAADGIAANECKSCVKKVLPSLLKDMNTLQLFDAIFAEWDRGLHKTGANYNVKIKDDNEAYSLVGFDYDYFCNLRTNLKRRLFEIPPMIKTDGCLNLLHLDRKFAQRVLNITDEQFVAVLSEFLQQKYIDAALNRLHQVQKALLCSIEKDKNFLLDNDEWTEKTIQEEKTEGDVKSYFNVFMRYIGNID